MPAYSYAKTKRHAILLLLAVFFVIFVTTGKNNVIDLFKNEKMSKSMAFPLSQEMKGSYRELFRCLEEGCLKRNIDHDVMILPDGFIFRVYNCYSANDFIWLITTRGPVITGLKCDEVMQRSFDFCFKDNTDSCVLTMKMMDSKIALGCCYDKIAVIPIDTRCKDSLNAVRK